MEPYSSVPWRFHLSGVNCNTFYNTVAQSFHLTTEKLPFEEKEKIREDFEREKFFAENLIQDLDHWVSFFFDKRRFPGSQDLVMLPQPKIPDFVRTLMALSPIDLYKKFSSTNAKALVSIQALAALNVYIGGDKDISREAMEEFLINLTFQALTNESNKLVIAFDKIGFLVNDLLEQFVKIEQELYKETLGKNLDKTINQTDFDIEVTPEVEIKKDVVKFQSGKKKYHLSLKQKQHL